MKNNQAYRRAYPPGMTIDRWVSADGWDHRRWSWLAEAARPVRGSMIFQTGRGDFFEKYLETLGHWHDAGWNLAGFDWRGQSGSGRFLDDPTVGHAESFDPWLAEFDEFATGWRTRMPAPHVVAAHSMGGHIVMRYVVERHPGFDGLVLSAPMLRMVSKPFPEPVAAFLARRFAQFGRARQHAWKENERPSLPGSSRQKLLTHDFGRYADEDWWVKEKPELKLGPPSWQWLAAAYASSKRLFARGGFESVKTPVLLLGAEQDKLVRIDAIREAARRLPDARLFVDAEAAHEVLRESDEIRDRFLAEIDRFLDEKVPLQA